jgi:hypothetical protein
MHALVGDPEQRGLVPLAEPGLSQSADRLDGGVPGLLADGPLLVPKRPGGRHRLSSVGGKTDIVFDVDVVEPPTGGWRQPWSGSGCAVDPRSSRSQRTPLADSPRPGVAR